MSSDDKQEEQKPSTNNKSSLPNEIQKQLKRAQSLFDPFMALLAAMLGLGMLCWVIYGYYDQNIRKYELVWAAGSQHTESYQVAQILREHLETELSNVRITIKKTHNTSANLELLTDGQVHLATVQADVVLDQWTSTSTVKLQNLGHVIAQLQTNRVHLLACTQIQDELTVTDVLQNLGRSKYPHRVYISYNNIQSADELKTFLRIANYYGLQRGKHFKIINDYGAEAPKCDSNEQGNMLFKVRPQRHFSVQVAIEKGWRLASFTHAEALSQTNKALTTDSIAQGTYRIDRSPNISAPEPPTTIQTLKVSHLLLARDDKTIPDFIVKAITESLTSKIPILSQHSSDTSLKNIFLELSTTNSSEDIKSLGIPIHPASAEVHDSSQKLNARIHSLVDRLGIYISITIILLSIILTINRGTSWLRKNRLDQLIEEATLQMTPNDNSHKADRWLFLELDTQEKKMLASLKANNKLFRLVDELFDGRTREQQLEKTFEKAANEFRSEQLSLEEFRTFSEVHKSVRNSIDNKNVKLRRDIVEFYVSALLHPELLEDNPFTELSNEQILDQALLVLSHSPAFSRDSFRTLAEAYDLAGRKTQ